MSCRPTRPRGSAATPSATAASSSVPVAHRIGQPSNPALTAPWGHRPYPISRVVPMTPAAAVRASLFPGRYGTRGLNKLDDLRLKAVPVLGREVVLLLETFGFPRVVELRPVVEVQTWLGGRDDDASHSLVVGMPKDRARSGEDPRFAINPLDQLATGVASAAVVCELDDVRLEPAGGLECPQPLQDH